MFPSPGPALEGAPQLTTGSMMGSMIWMIVALALVIGLIVLLIKFLSKRSQLWSGPRSLQSLAGMTLAQGKSIQLVEVAGKIYVLGIGDNVAALDIISDPDAVEAVRQQLSKQTNAASTSPAAEWMKLLQGKVAGRRETARQAGEGGDAKRFEMMLQQKLEQQSRQQEELEHLLQETRDRERLREE
ncbi:flagellar biosynthetic protein FliO [Paenibacillus herberti]|uniref:flagellar biosynthetic protein FliO n=1 Tax=Paenibacillus herberti TaxID=1619309 RepID=UPI0015953DCB|nr:flagellar biosynthetic protein FliO [Paenibacillus herberti]